MNQDLDEFHLDLIVESPPVAAGCDLLLALLLAALSFVAGFFTGVLL